MKHLEEFYRPGKLLRDYVPNYAQLCDPLNKMIKDYKSNKHKKLVWTERRFCKAMEGRVGLHCPVFQSGGGKCMSLRMLQSMVLGPVSDY
jgi:hypothetical protein